MPLRKVNLAVNAAPSNNMASFTNVTARRLHIRKTVGTGNLQATVTALDHAILELAEQSTAVSSTNDSRALIDTMRFIVGDSTAYGLGLQPTQRAVLAFNRNDLVLDTDESLFVNGTDVVGTATIRANWNLFYED